MTYPTIELSEIVKPGDRILIGCGAGEPLALTEALVAQRHRLPDVEVLLGYTIHSTIKAEHTDRLKVTVLGGYGANRELTAAGAAAVLPCHQSSVPELIEQGKLRVDVLFLQCTPADAFGNHSLGVTSDALPVAMRYARTVIAEVNDQMPHTHGDTVLSGDRIDHKLHTSRPLPQLISSPASAVDQRIAEHVANLVPNRAVLQMGIGKTPEAAAALLREHRDLGIHSGLLGDWAVDLVECGAVTNAAKPIDQGITVGGLLMGTQRLYDWADRNPELAVRQTHHTHGATVLAQLDSMVSINSAIEIDLTGQVNSELAGDRYLGAIGGQVDYVRAGASAPGGLSILTLRSTSRGRSGIVPRLHGGVVTTARSDIDIVVTEHGVAELRGRNLADRARLLSEIADPQFREQLDRHQHHMH